MPTGVLNNMFREGAFRPPSIGRRAKAYVIVAALALAALLAPSISQSAATDWVGIHELPPEARETLALIRSDGPFPYPKKDGSVFRNFEKRLPIQPTGYYREYTVPTPGVRHRGARRIVAGKGLCGNVRCSGEYWYTSDHYRSFRRIQTPPDRPLSPAD